MDVLMDIIKFLKKLQNGQHDIEAGQFELYEGMASVNKALDELKTVKQDVDNMKASNAQQLGIIKDLEVKLNHLQRKYKSKGPRSCTTTYFSDEYGDNKKGFKKIHKRIEEVVDITSHVSNDRWNSEASENEKKEQDECSKTETEENCSEEKPEEFCVSSQDKKRHRCQNSEMLQRYLQDSAKYRDRISSRASAMSNDITEKNDQNSSYCKGTDCEDSNKDSSNSLEENSRTSKQMSAKSFMCPVCYKKFKKAIDYSMHKKKHVVVTCRICRKTFSNKERLKQHQVVHKNKPKNFEGFTCCYCHLVCSTPEKLTAHLRKCRIITKTSPKRL